MSINEELGNYGLIPVTVFDDADKAVDTAKALAKAGLPVMEITLRTPAGIEAIRRVRNEMEDFLLGAGTVLTLEQCKEAVAAGASYIVSPGYDDEIVDWCLENNIAVVPGCVTPTEITRALKKGLKILKFFPASVYGGISALKALYAPFASTGIGFIPTGGINVNNMGDYADKEYIHAIGGGWLTDKAAINAGDFDKITATASEAVAKMLGFEVVHVGINTENGDAAMDVANDLGKAFGWEVNPGNSSVFSSKGVEVMKSIGLGAKGHIAVRTNNVKRAAFYLEKRGYKMNPDSCKYKNGRMNAVYLDHDFGGFAVHLLQK